MRISVNSEFVKYFTHAYVSRLPKLMRVSYGGVAYTTNFVGVYKVSESVVV